MRSLSLCCLAILVVCVSAQIDVNSDLTRTVHTEVNYTLPSSETGTLQFDSVSHISTVGTVDLGNSSSPTPTPTPSPTPSPNSTATCTLPQPPLGSSPCSYTRCAPDQKCCEMAFSTNSSIYAVCYDPTQQLCARRRAFLCPCDKPFVCGDECYDLNQNQCYFGWVLCATGQDVCGYQCYDPSNETCNAGCLFPSPPRNPHNPPGPSSSSSSTGSSSDSSSTGGSTGPFDPDLVPTGKPNRTVSISLSPILTRIQIHNEIDHNHNVTYELYVDNRCALPVAAHVRFFNDSANNFTTVNMTFPAGNLTTITYVPTFNSSHSEFCFYARAIGNPFFVWEGSKNCDAGFGTTGFLVDIAKPDPTKNVMGLNLFCAGSTTPPFGDIQNNMRSVSPRLGSPKRPNPKAFFLDLSSTSPPPEVKVRVGQNGYGGSVGVSSPIGNQGQYGHFEANANYDKGWRGKPTTNFQAGYRYP